MPQSELLSRRWERLSPNQLNNVLPEGQEDHYSWRERYREGNHRPKITWQLTVCAGTRMMKYGERIGKFPDNVWLGVTVESAPYKFRISHLQETSCRTRFLSIEPLIAPLGRLDLNRIHWVIAGGESGPNHRPCRVEWLREIRDQCIRDRVPFFFKQWGGSKPKSGGRQLDRREWNEFPKAQLDNIVLKTIQLRK